MRTKLLGAFCLLFPLLSVAADIQRITPITSDNSVKIEVTLSAEAGEHLLLDAVKGCPSSGCRETWQRLLPLLSTRRSGTILPHRRFARRKKIWLNWPTY